MGFAPHSTRSRGILGKPVLLGLSLSGGIFVIVATAMLLGFPATRTIILIANGAVAPLVGAQ